MSIIVSLTIIMGDKLSIDIGRERHSALWLATDERKRALIKDIINRVQQEFGPSDESIDRVIAGLG